MKMLLARIQTYKEANSVSAGPQGPRAIAKQILPSLRTPMEKRLLMSQVRRDEFRLACGYTITAVALGLHNPMSFDQQIVRMPVFWRHAPLGLQEPRSRIIWALTVQQLVEFKVIYAQLLGVCILLGQAKPTEAFRMFMPIDEQGGEQAIFGFELCIGLPMYGYVLAVEGACAAGQRVLDAWA